MSYADEMTEPADVCGCEVGSIVVRLSLGQRAALRRLLVGIFETSTDEATLTASRRVLDALEVA